MEIEAVELETGSSWNLKLMVAELLDLQGHLVPKGHLVMASLNYIIKNDPRQAHSSIHNKAVLSPVLFNYLTYQCIVATLSPPRTPPRFQMPSMNSCAYAICRLSAVCMHDACMMHA